jgi:hypothetical protein
LFRLTASEPCIEPQHAPARAFERAVTAHIRPRAPRVIAAIDLDDEPHAGRREVSHVAANRMLPAKRHALLLALERLPQLD